MLRRTLRQNKVEENKVLTDVEILLQARCVPVRVRLAQHRLGATWSTICAARTAM